MTPGSDVDWTLLVDGQADPNHFRVARSITDRFEQAGVKRPGRTGVFGGLAFSQQIVHDISTAAIFAYQEIATLLPAGLPVIVESVVEPAQIEDELAKAIEAVSASPQAVA